jgi:hypothetical protein
VVFILHTGGILYKQRIMLGLLWANLLLLPLAPACRASAAPVQLSLWNPIQLFSDDSDITGIRLNLLYGNNRNICGLDIGLINQVARHCQGAQVAALLNDTGFFNNQDVLSRMTGCQLSLAMNSAGNINGLQAAGLANLVRADMVGMQLGCLLGNVCMGDGHGVQLGPANITLKSITGVQLAGGIIIAANIAENVQGVQASVAGVSLNKADEMCGLQLNVGLMGNYAADVAGAQIAATCNLADHVKGIQVGLVNYCRSMAGLQVGVINIIMDGGLPVFPVVNARF